MAPRYSDFMTGGVTYEEFAAWRESLSKRPTVGEAMRAFPRTHMDTLMAWMEHYRQEQGR